MFNDPIEIILIIITVIAAVIFLGRGWIRIINTAYSESTLQGRLCMFPLYAIYYAIKKQHSELKSVITEFMKTVATRNVEAAYAYWSPQSATKEDIAELIKSKRDVFVGYERLSINSLGTRSVGGITESDVGGAIIYIDGKRLPFKARLVKENDVWKITGIRVGSTALLFT